MFCKNCGAEIGEGKKFCPKCGQNLLNSVNVTIQEKGLNSNNNRVSLKADTVLKRIYRIAIIVFEIFLLSQSLVSCGHKGYESIIYTFSPDHSVMVSSKSLTSGLTGGSSGVYVVSFITILYILILIFSITQKDQFWKINLHTNIYIPFALGVTTCLYNYFGTSYYKPTANAYICVGMSIFITILYIIIDILTKVDNKKYSALKGFLILIVLQIIHMYFFGALIPFVTGNIS